MTTTEAARLAAHRAWANYAPEAAQVARDAAIDRGWTADRWFRAYQGVQPFEPPIGWPVGIATVSHRAWRPSRATLRSPGAWAPNAACYSWWIGSLTKPGGLWVQDRGRHHHPPAPVRHRLLPAAPGRDSRREHPRPRRHPPPAPAPAAQLRVVGERGEDRAVHPTLRPRTPPQPAVLIGVPVPALVTLCVRRARRMVGSRAMHGMKRAAHRAARRVEHANTRAAARHVDPDVPNHPMADARIVNDSSRCTSMSAEYDGRPIRCIYQQGHATDHCDGCVTWENNDPPLSQRDEPRHREPRRLTSWDVV